MDIAAEICASLADEWLPTIYQNKIRPQRTRSVSIEVPERENQAEIQYTLLGIELKVGKRRFACPDLATARYMRIFARIGCIEFAVPYDITKISTLADDLETSWQKILLLQAEKMYGRPSRGASQTRSKLIKALRIEIGSIGAGEARPQFTRETKQRKI
ncbi:MAG: hypothetical protein ABIO36_06500 [Pyrinomonadaceae bacterium]